MIYDLSKKDQLEPAKKRFEQLFEKRSRFELTEKKKSGRISQNAYLHLIIGWAAVNHGYTFDEMKHYIFKIEANTDLFYDGEVGELVKINRWRSVKDLEPDEMNVAINNFRRYMQANGLYLPEPRDMAALYDIEEHLGRFKELRNGTV